MITMQRPLRRGLSGVLVLAAVGLLLFQSAYRGFEASVAERLFGLFTTTSANGGDPVVFFGFGRPGAFGLEITPECSSAFLIAPIALVAGALASRPRLPLLRIILAFLLAAGLLAVGNQVRVGLIAGLIEIFGLQESYRWGHTIVGSLVSILFVAGALCLFVGIVVRGRSADADREPRS